MCSAILMPCLGDAAILDVACRMSVSDLCVKNPRAAQNFLKDRVLTCSNSAARRTNNPISSSLSFASVEEISSLIGQRIQAGIQLEVAHGGTMHP